METWVGVEAWTFFGLQGIEPTNFTRSAFAIGTPYRALLVGSGVREYLAGQSFLELVELPRFVRNLINYYGFELLRT